MPSKSGGLTFNESFITKLNANGNALVYSTYVGGGQGGNHTARSIAVDSIDAHVMRPGCAPLQADGKILVGGEFTTTLGGGGTGTATRSSIGRNGDGSLDTSFNPNVGGAVYALAVRPDGKILVGGRFEILASETRPNVV